MRLAYSNGGGADCCVCDWRAACPEGAGLERKVREHLRADHGRLLVTKSEIRGGFSYDGPRMGQEMFRG